MVSAKTFSDETAADKSSIGFDYQYYFFLWKVLCLQPEQSVGLECKDDVHTDLDNDIQVLYQLKHTIKKSKSTGKPKNLTTLDHDLWKTFSNWATLIKDPKSSRVNNSEQLNFIRKTLFVLASNKSETKNNEISSIIDETISGALNSSNLKSAIKKISDKSTSEDISNYSKNILSLADEVLFHFFKKISFELGEEYIIEKCFHAVKAKMIEDEDVEHVFKLVDSSIRENNFIDIKVGKKNIISFNDFHKKYRKYFQNYQNKKLIVYDFDDELPSEIKQFTFIKQLLEIGDLNIEEIDCMMDYTSLMFKAKENINKWYSNGDITDVELKSLKENTLLLWKNNVRKRYRAAFEESVHNELALDVLDRMREEQITFDVLPHDMSISNGYLYHLSDIPNLGWRKDWEKYKK